MQVGTSGIVTRGRGMGSRHGTELPPRRYLAWVMSVSVLLFASYADAFGSRHLDVSVATPCAVSEVVRALRGLPGGATLPEKPLVAINQVYATLDAVVHPHDEVAFIPPVAGG